jgi:hypothetical protein
MLAEGATVGAADVKDTISIKSMSKYYLSFQVTWHQGGHEGRQVGCH